MSLHVLSVCLSVVRHAPTAVEEAEVGADEAHVVVLWQPRHLLVVVMDDQVTSTVHG